MALSLLPVVFENLNSMIKKEVGLLLGVDKEMKKLSSILSTIRAVLEDAEQKQLQDWLRKLKDATYEVDDILDECATEAHQGESEDANFSNLKFQQSERGLPSMKSLRHLKINHCNNLRSLSEGLGHLTALEKLDVQGCPKLVALPKSIKHLNSLRHLSLRGRPTCWSPDDFPISARMKTLPEPLQHVPALQSLDIYDYPELTSLPEWLGNLTSLQSLRIGGCPKVESLPDRIESLPKLQTLEFTESTPWEEGRGEHWFFTQHTFPVHSGVTVFEPFG